MTLSGFITQSNQLQKHCQSAFTIPILYDKTFLVVPVNDESLQDQILKVLAPFTPGAWLLILSIICASAILSVVFTDRFTERHRGRPSLITRPRYRRKSAYVRLCFDSFLEKGTVSSFDHNFLNLSTMFTDVLKLYPYPVLLQCRCRTNTGSQLAT